MSQHMQRLIITIFWVLSWVAGLASQGSCWRGEYNEHRCCVEQDPGCWDTFFTPAACCPQQNGDAATDPRHKGNRQCWLDGYTFDDCCGDEPKIGCWDAEFTAQKCCIESTVLGVSEPVDVTREDVTDAYVRVTTAARDLPIGCDGAASDIWAAVKVASAALNISRRYGMVPVERPGESFMDKLVLFVLSWVQNKEAWSLARQTCPIGSLNAIDLAVAQVDKEIGEDKARALYSLHEGFRNELVAKGSWPPLLGNWMLLSDGFEYVPKLFGFTQRHHCYGSSIRIFVYDLPKLSHMLSPLLTCSQKMSFCTTSVHIHRWLLNSHCITDDPERADFFYLPAYEACRNESACGFGEDTERCFPQDFDPAVDLPYFSRRNGADHLFVFGCNLLPFRDSIMIRARQSILVTVESFGAENLAGPNMLAWLSHWKDVLIPGYIPRWRIDAMLAFNKPMRQRPLLLAFHGHTKKSKNVGYMYERSPLAAVRDRIINYFWNKTSISVGLPVRDYFRRMGRSRFCLAPAGLTAWTTHLYEAFFFGCIPVILSDELSVPFHREVPWATLSLHVPTSIGMEELHAKLANFSMGRLKVMYRALEEARCWFDYSLGWDAQASGCSPFKALMSALEERRARQRFYDLPPHWEPPHSTDSN